MNTHAVIETNEEVERLTDTPDAVQLLFGQSLVQLAEPVRGWPEGDGTLHCGADGVLYWVDTRTLEQARASKLAEINAAYMAANLMFEHAGKWFQANEHSWKQISGVQGHVTRTGALPGWFTAIGAWKAEDNTYHPIPDVAEWDAFFNAALQRGADNFVQAQARKAAIEAATTVAEVDAVAWE